MEKEFGGAKFRIRKSGDLSGYVLLCKNSVECTESDSDYDSITVWGPFMFGHIMYFSDNTAAFVVGNENSTVGKLKTFPFFCGVDLNDEEELQKAELDWTLFLNKQKFNGYSFELCRSEFREKWDEYNERLAAVIPE